MNYDRCRFSVVRCGRHGHQHVRGEAWSESLGLFLLLFDPRWHHPAVGWCVGMVVAGDAVKMTTRETVRITKAIGALCQTCWKRPGTKKYRKRWICVPCLTPREKRNKQ